jgi:hypothetical protein
MKMMMPLLQLLITSGLMALLLSTTSGPMMVLQTTPVGAMPPMTGALLLPAMAALV